MQAHIASVMLTIAGTALSMGALLVGGYLTYRNQTRRQAIDQELATLDGRVDNVKEWGASAELNWAFGNLFEGLGIELSSELLVRRAYDTYYFTALLRRASAAAIETKPPDEEIDQYRTATHDRNGDQVFEAWERLGEDWMNENNDIVRRAAQLRIDKDRLSRAGDRTVYAALSLQVLGLLVLNLRDLVQH